MKNILSSLVALLLLALTATTFAQPKLVIERGNAKVSLVLTGLVGGIYEIYEASSLTAPIWTSVTNFQLKATSLRFTQDVASVTARFYRARLISATNLVGVPSGTFMMGSPDNEQDRQIYEGPQHQVTISRPFYVAQYEVTQAGYFSLMATNPSTFVGLSRPVETVSWSDATNYCGKLTVQERNAGRIPANWSYRLPTEAEWEYVARAGTTTRFNFGDDPSYSNLGTYAWYSGNSSNTTHSVGTKSPNPMGIYDLYGNVGEYCSDWMGSYSTGSVTDPTGPETGYWHVWRGGNYYTSATYSRSASREDSNAPWNYLGGVGFRVVLSSTTP